MAPLPGGTYSNESLDAEGHVTGRGRGWGPEFRILVMLDEGVWTLSHTVRISNNTVLLLRHRQQGTSMPRFLPQHKGVWARVPTWGPFRFSDAKALGSPVGISAEPCTRQPPTRVCLSVLVRSSACSPNSYSFFRSQQKHNIYHEVNEV